MKKTSIKSASFLLFTVALVVKIDKVDAQQLNLKALIVQQDSSAINDGTVYLYNEAFIAQHSSIWKGGQLNLTIDPKKTPIVRFSALGYAVEEINLNKLSLKNTQKPLIVLLKANTTLEEVTVTGQKKSIRQEGDKLVFDVSKSAMAIGGTADEILKKTPMVHMRSDGTVTIVGKGTSMILLDGMPISKDILQSIPSSNIQKIEVITNPDASYDAAGAGIINIISKKNQFQTSYTLVDASVSKGKRFRESIGIQSGYMLKKWKFDAKYRYFPSQVQYEDRFHRIIGSESSAQYAKMDQIVEKNRNIPNRHSFSLASTYQINEQLRVYADGNHIITGSNSNDNGLNLGLKNGESFQLQNSTYGTTNSHSTIVNYGSSWNSKDKHHRLNFDGSHTFYRYKKNDNIREIYTETDARESSKINNNNNRINISLFKTDYSWKPTKSTKLDLGLKLTQSSNRSSLLFSQFDGNNWITEENEFNSYHYKENISAAYVSFDTRINKLQIKAGLRMEHTDAKGISALNNRSLIDSGYNDLFPSLSLTYPLAKDWEISANYQKRITRPQYQLLNPYKIYIDSLSIISGNPMLKPELTNYFETAISFKKLASLKVNYSRTKNSIQTIIRQLEEGSLITMATYENLNHADALNFTLSVPYQKGRFTSYNAVSFTKNFVKADIQGQLFDFKKPFWYFYTYNEFRISDTWSLELTGSYNTSGLMGIFVFDPKLNVSAAVKKVLIKDKLTLNLSANDIFNKDLVRTRTTLNNFNLQYRGFEDNRYIRLALSYKIGNSKNLTGSKSVDSRIKQD